MTGADNVVDFPTRKPAATPGLPSRGQLIRRAIDHVERATVGTTLALDIAPGDPLEEAVALLSRARNILVSANPAWQPETETVGAAEEHRTHGTRAVIDQSRAPGQPTHTGQGPSDSTTGDAA